MPLDRDGLWEEALPILDGDLLFLVHHQSHFAVAALSVLLNMILPKVAKRRRFLPKRQARSVVCCV